MKSLLVIGMAVALILVGSAVFTALYARLMEARYPPTGRFLDVDGLRLHYVDRSPAGETPEATIVLLHGASSNLAESMLGLGDALSRRYRVIAFDRPGHGYSERGSGLESAEPGDQARVIADALRQLGIRRALVAGHSLAGAVVARLALDHTDVTGGILILSGATYPWPGGAISWYHRLAASPFGRVVTATIATPLALMIFRPAAAQSFAPQDMPRDFTERAQIGLLLRPDTMLANGRDVAVLHAAVERQSPRYGEIRLPATVIGGDADDVVWTDLHSRSFARDVPDAQLVVLPGIGHMPQYVRGDLVRREIDALADRMAILARAD
jgi:pimeloyl-ACP methyl ester carboxylesterase